MINVNILSQGRSTAQTENASGKEIKEKPPKISHKHSGGLQLPETSIALKRAKDYLSSSGVALSSHLPAGSTLARGNGYFMF